MTVVTRPNVTENDGHHLHNLIVNDSCYSHNVIENDGCHSQNVIVNDINAPVLQVAPGLDANAEVEGGSDCYNVVHGDRAVNLPKQCYLSVSNV